MQTVILVQAIKVCNILLHSTFECDRASISIIIHLVCSNDVSADVLFSMGWWFALMCAVFLVESEDVSGM